MRISVATGFGRTGIAQTVDLAQRLERGGFAGVLVEEAWREPIVPLTAVALATNTIGIGTGIAQIFPINPVVAAQQAAQINELAGNRHTLGLGLGAGFVVERWFGVTYERPLTRMREFVEVVRGILRSPETGPFSYDGSVFRVRKYLLRTSERAVDVPIHIAAVGPKMLELAGEVADGIIVGAIHSPASMEQLAERVAAGAQRSGRDPAQVAVRYFLPCAVSADPAIAQKFGRATLAYTAQYEHYRKALGAEGFGEEADTVAALARQGRMDDARSAVTDAMLERFTIMGDVDDCRRQLARYASYPGHPVLFTVPYGIDEDPALASLRRLADELHPDDILVGHAG